MNQPASPHPMQPGPQAWTASRAPAWSWSGRAKKGRKAARSEWLKIAGISVGIGLLALGISLVVDGLGPMVFVVGYAVMLTWALRLVSAVGPEGPIHLDQTGLWFDGVLQLPLGSIQWIDLMPASKAATTQGVGVRAFAGGIKVYSGAGMMWFELRVPVELVQLARALGMRVNDPPGGMAAR